MKRVQSASPFEARYSFCRALRIGDRLEVAGTAPIPQDGSPPPPQAFDQATLCFRIAEEALTKLAPEGHRVVRTRMYIIDEQDQDAVGRAHGAAFAGQAPVATMVVVRGLLDEAWKVEIEVEAVAGAD